ncbi:hypothetical protein [Zhihengliuella salsuginis]|uniref:Transcriptional regulator, AbiEi antitoxin, Type IV TA system n=1 Tax=Zhihengliuella salsuginis TaxID=578222 RepID=A0ABQ3GAQ1_9MICC|nr:hypothetical protein [Zhihengliuella salsuginis]GHC98854.1 hypothetical protein GCM10008096_00340 [Zhihengliuella salsuginis]
MPLRRPLPSELQGRVFTARQAVDLGVSRSRLRAADVTRLATGVYVHDVEEPTELAQVAALRYWRPDLWLTHASAARTFGLWVPPAVERDARLHVSLPQGRRTVTAGGVSGHTLIAGPDEVLRFDGVPHAPQGLAGAVSSPARTWLDLAPLLSIEELVVLGDQLVRRPYLRFDGRRTPWATRDSLTDLLAAHAQVAGAVRAREALKLVRVGADSPPETRMRLAILRAGLPEPGLQVRPNPGDRHAIPADLGYREHRIALHYEGGGHRSPDQLERDIRRDEAFSASGWTNLRFTSVDGRQGFGRAVLLLRQILGHQRERHLRFER